MALIFRAVVAVVTVAVVVDIVATPYLLLLILNECERIKWHQCNRLTASERVYIVSCVRIYTSSYAVRLL